MVDSLTNAVLDVVHDTVTSHWIYAALFLLAAIDGFLPIFPSESVVIIAGVYAASDGPNLLLVIVVAALGAFVGDHISYAIGRGAGHRILARASRDSRRRKGADWAKRTLAKRGGLVLVVARYIPGGRTMTTLMMGTVKYPLRLFSIFDAIAALSWGTYSALVGYIGGKAFEDAPFKGVLLGLGLAVSITILIELIGRIYRRTKSTPDIRQRILNSARKDEPCEADASSDDHCIDRSYTTGTGRCSRQDARSRGIRPFTTSAHR